MLPRGCGPDAGRGRDADCSRKGRKGRKGRLVIGDWVEGLKGDGC